MKSKIRIISSYQPTEKTKRRFDRLALLILENDSKQNFVNQKDNRLDKIVSEDKFS